ncbi:tripartite tricarboxylate transporter substrate binding protein [Bordetella sp. BOR01]|uniref:Bug family tripartite tricarboxylate transporter substrate binding protein n=1 Tax=Bordetella sp. BOR01 TaxID=2854779 RepID=UPI001C451168|nr:tripartite tricarboxylate transporter substrate binding protein [Bordetella sp. BOR01]MBV7482903.1 tripartite tricarboxylate transporter substrate binding protein [Bordetella sp. BOR01]
MRKLLLVAALLAAIPLHSQAADPYPSRPVTITVPFGAGASIGSIARIVADKLAARLGQPFVVEYKPGAGGTIGSAHVAAKKPDGYSLLVSATGTMSIAPVLYKNLTYKSEDLTPVAQMMRVPFVIASGSEFKGKTLAELIAQLEAQPGKYNFASTGNGTLVHLAGQLFLDQFGGKAEHVPYAAGSEVAVALISGDVLFSVANISTVSPHFAGGRIKALAITGPERFPLLPDVPTVAASGLKDFSVRHYVGIFGPPGLPADIADKLNQEINEILRQPEVEAAFQAQGDIPVPASRDAFAQTVASDAKAWGSLARQMNLAPN